ncbi:MAG: cupin domain-containing protein [Actinomycetota bacterium]
MTFLTRPGEGPRLSYAGQQMHILAGADSQPPGFAAMEITIPANFGGPIPHAHDDFDEAIYVLRGELQVTGDGQRMAAAAGSMFAAPRGQRHSFSNPHGSEALVLGIWAPAEPALAFMREIGEALTPGEPPDPELMREIYTRHSSRLLP